MLTENVKVLDRLVIDSQAMMAYLGQEPAGGRVRELLRTSEPWMILITLGEVAYLMERLHGPEAADLIFSGLLASELRGKSIRIRWLPVDESLVRRAASLKAHGGMSYADCFVAAAADILECPVLTGDREFTKAEEAGIAVHWF